MTQDYSHKNRSWIVAIAIASLLTGQQVYAQEGSILAAGPLGNRNHDVHRKLQTYTAADDVNSLLLVAVNAERAAVGLSALCSNSKLKVAAQLHTEDQATHGKMSHTSSNGSTVSERVDAQGFIWSSLGENVAAGYPNVSSVMAAWMNSTGHKANILNSGFTFFGGGYAYNATDSYCHYWTQNFGSGTTEVCNSTSLTSSPTPTTLTPTTSTPTPSTSDLTELPAPTPTNSDQTPTPTPSLTPTPTPTSGLVQLNGVCGNDAVGAGTCVNGAYCQPWTPATYECIALPSNAMCGVPVVNVDIQGADLLDVVLRDLSPHQCCDECVKASGCVAYTFTNTNSDNTTACSLKSGTGTSVAKKGTISVLVSRTS